MIKRILIAYDGSESADKAYAFALDLAKKFGADLTVLSVSRPPDFAEEVEMESILENSTKHYEKLLANLQKQATPQGITPSVTVVVGHPAEQMIYYAEQHNIDHIVMGHRGKTFFQRLRLGSVSKQVIQYAQCSVTVVR